MNRTSVPNRFFIFGLLLLLAALFLSFYLYNSDAYRFEEKAAPFKGTSWLQSWTKNNTFELKTSDIRDHPFDPVYGNDVMVFLHIQKTGGTTFGKHLVQNLGHCKCNGKNHPRCDCRRPGNDTAVWLFSRYSTGWLCGIHADWTELTNCVPYLYELGKKPIYRDGETGKLKDPRYYYVTMLRNPVKRYISEWQHVGRGATWNKSRHMCNGRLPTPKELPKCYHGKKWINVTLDGFLNCKYNLANNRQTRMLADLSLVGCYNLTKMPEKRRNKIMLLSAKHNLQQFAYFGITENQLDSQFIFEETFKLYFNSSFTHGNATVADKSTVTPQQYERIKQLNSLDLELFEFAKSLFFQRKAFYEARKKERQSRNITDHL